MDCTFYSITLPTPFIKVCPFLEFKYIKSFPSKKYKITLIFFLKAEFALVLFKPAYIFGLLGASYRIVFLIV